jgi:hypothetical protein
VKPISFGSILGGAGRSLISKSQASGQGLTRHLVEIDKQIKDYPTEVIEESVAEWRSLKHPFLNDNFWATGVADNVGQEYSKYSHMKKESPSAFFVRLANRGAREYIFVSHEKSVRPPGRSARRLQNASLRRPFYERNGR